MKERTCAWCGRPIRSAARRDAKTCSKPCRQAKSRFRVAPAGAVASVPMTFAYADPPYPGLARKYYDCEEVDHEQLVSRLMAEFPQGWALSTSSDALQDVLALCPTGVRVSAWVNGARPGVSMFARDAWEPLIRWGGRPRRLGPAEKLSNALIWGGRQPSHPGALVGMKPAAFAEWMFRQLGAMKGDTLVDLFPGSGAIQRAWAMFCGDEYSHDPSKLELRQIRASDIGTGSCLAGAQRRLEELVHA